MCFFQGNQMKGYCRGHGVILDNQYRIVRSVQAGGGMSSSDMHEFWPINGGKSALMTVYQQRQYDMSRWGIHTGVAWIMESIFQEVDVETSEVLFEWRSLDHVDPSVSYTLPATTDTSGDGLNPLSPWDYFHINSIEKNKDGDYLISSRHTCAIYKLSGKDGSIIWRLNGARPSFRNLNFSFSQQHDARWISENSTHTILSLYNNGFNGYNQTADYSSGMIIVIDHVAMTAELVAEYAPPGKTMLSSSQGNMQILPNKNVFMGWGNNPFISEHAEDGTLLLWAYFAKGVTMNYRALKYDWDAEPSDSPALWAYSKTAAPQNPMSFYVSWNGATRVKSWRFYGSQRQTGKFDLLATVEKSGFETEYQHTGFYAWAYAEALDKNGYVIGRSTTRLTFVPSPELGTFCGETFCENAPAYGFPGEDDPAPEIPPPIPFPEEHDEPDGSPMLQGSISDANDEDGGKSTDNPTLPYANVGLSDQEEDQEEPPAWVVPTSIATAILLVLLFVVLRYYVWRKRTSEAFKDHDSDEDNLESSKYKASLNRYDLPWWHWRRWGIKAVSRQRYSPLGDREVGPHEG